MSTKETPKLATEVAQKFDLVGVSPGKHKFAKYGTIDLTVLSVKDAQALVKAGFPYLKPKGKDDKTETAPAK